MSTRAKDTNSSVDGIHSGEMNIALPPGEGSAYGSSDCLQSTCIAAPAKDLYVGGSSISRWINLECVEAVSSNKTKHFIADNL
jgi:hypothetical protein